jgi:tRNA threonylcarbamoyladenosine biosynthesis protein TsaB
VLTLALDTTTRAGSAAVLDGAAVLSVVYGDAALTHGERLPGELDQALRTAGVAAQDLQLLAVAVGPGAFTGLRIGLASMQGLATVLNIPVVGVSALEALAVAAAPSGAPSDSIATWVDAHRGEVFAALYRPWPSLMRPADPEGGVIVAAPQVVLVHWAHEGWSPRSFTGDGAVRYRDDITGPTHGGLVIAPPAALAPYLGQIGQSRASRGEAGFPHALQPMYVRRPDAELERLKRP